MHYLSRFKSSCVSRTEISAPDPNRLDDILAMTFNVFGTISDHHHAIARELVHWAPRILTLSKAEEFALDWHTCFLHEIASATVTEGSGVTPGIVGMHRNILEKILRQPRWKQLDDYWNEAVRNEVSTLWHQLDACSDASESIHRLQRHTIVAALLDRNFQLLLEMARQFPWDTIIYSELIAATKPSPEMYLDSCKHLGLPPSRCAIVSANLLDLQEAAKAGLKTIYVRRSVNDSHKTRTTVHPGTEGEVDLIVDSLIELATLVEHSRRQPSKL